MVDGFFLGLTIGGLAAATVIIVDLYINGFPAIGIPSRADRNKK